MRARFDDEDISFDIYQHARDLIELSGNKLLPEQEPPKNGLHLWTLKRKANAVSNRVSIREYACPLHFRCNCRVGLRVVQGDYIIQLERRGLHHINSHVAHTIDDDAEAQELIDDSVDNDDFDDDHTDDEDSENDGDSEHEDARDNYSENSSDCIQSICFPYQK